MENALVKQFKYDIRNAGRKSVAVAEAFSQDLTVVAIANELDLAHLVAAELRGN